MPFGSHCRAAHTACTAQPRGATAALLAFGADATLLAFGTAVALLADGSAATLLPFGSPSRKSYSKVRPALGRTFLFSKLFLTPNILT